MALHLWWFEAMDWKRLQDRLDFGMGAAARHTGQTADAYRPKDTYFPIRQENRFLQLPVTLLPAKGNANGISSYAEPFWRAIFDASYTRPGDYLRLPFGVFFIASQPPLLPVLCILTNRTISITRPSAQTATGTNPYGGLTAQNSPTLIENWPASVLAQDRLSTGSANLPADQSVPYWTVMLPAPPDVLFSPGDMINDDLGRSAVIAGSELTDVGWRVNAKMATT